VGALSARVHDLLVVGGGIHGAAAAWDAAQRGLDVALVEAADFGAGASWNSLKTVHGGLRHLQRLDLRGLRESARERRALLGIAPRLVRPLPFLVPTYGHGPKGREAFALGLRLNDLLTRDRNRGLPPEQRIPAGAVLSPAEVRERLPGVATDGLTGGALWTDAQVASTERLLLAFLHAAAGAGACLANYAPAQELLREGARVTGARVRDAEEGGTVEARARMTLVAAGEGADALVGPVVGAWAPVPRLQAINLVLRRRAASVGVGARQGGRFLFLVPWGSRGLVGTEYAPAEAPPLSARRFLAEAQRAFPWAGLRAEDVALVHRGLVPGRGGADGLWTRHRLTDHEDADGVAGLVSVVPAKYTTARAVAEAAVDVVARRLGRAAAACRTAVTPLPEVAPEPAEEMALHLTDAVLRRLDLGAGGPPPPEAVAPVAAEMAARLGWDDARRARETASLAAFYEGAALEAVE
jgi:glycerol-3-phosphate dehydrogenase